MNTATTPRRIAKAALLIDRVKVDPKGRRGMFSVDSTSGTTYRCIIWPQSWTCNCKWGDVHAFETNNECAHALAARYYAADHDLNLEGLSTDILDHDALDTCNACDAFGVDPKSAAGYCSSCEREAQAGDPLKGL